MTMPQPCHELHTLRCRGHCWTVPFTLVRERPWTVTRDVRDERGFIWSVWFIWSIWSVWFVWSVWFNQTNETNQPVLALHGSTGSPSQAMSRDAAWSVDAGGLFQHPARMAPS